MVLLISSNNNFDLKLKTQVLDKDQIALLGIDQWNKEQLRLVMIRKEDGSVTVLNTGITQKGTVKQWGNVSDGLSDSSDDLTSNGGQSNLTPASGISGFTNNMFV